MMSPATYSCTASVAIMAMTARMSSPQCPRIRSLNMSIAVITITIPSTKYAVTPRAISAPVSQSITPVAKPTSTNIMSLRLRRNSPVDDIACDASEVRGAMVWAGTVLFSVSLREG